MPAIQVKPLGVIEPQENVKPRADKHRITPAISLTAGATAGAIEAATTYPFEFAKTRAQLRESGQLHQSRNPFRLISQVVRNEGVGALYTGCTTLVFGTALKAAVRFVSFDAIKNSMADKEGRLSSLDGIFAGMIAGAIESVVAVTPTERIKTALIDDAKGAKRMQSFFQGTRLIIAEQGISGIYKGLVATTLKQSATSAVRMGSYNVLKESLKRHQLPLTGLTAFAMGAAAGTITVYATQPFDTIKTRAQSARGQNMGAAFRDVISERGLVGLWSGSTMRLGRLVLSGGIVFSVYEQISASLLALKTSI